MLLTFYSHHLVEKFRISFVFSQCGSRFCCFKFHFFIGIEESVQSVARCNTRSTSQSCLIRKSLRNFFLLAINFFRGNLSSGKSGPVNKQPEQPKVPPKKVEAKKVDPKKEATPQRQTSPVKNLKEAEKVRYSDPQNKQWKLKT